MIDGIMGSDGQASDPDYRGVCAFDTVPTKARPLTDHLRSYRPTERQSTGAMCM